MQKAWKNCCYPDDKKNQITESPNFFNLSESYPSRLKSQHSASHSRKSSRDQMWAPTHGQPQGTTESWTPHDWVGDCGCFWATAVRTELLGTTDTSVTHSYLPFSLHTSKARKTKTGTGQVTRENSQDTRWKGEGSSPPNRKGTTVRAQWDTLRDRQRQKAH